MREGALDVIFALVMVAALIVIVVMIGLGAALALFLWGRGLSNEKRCVLAALAGPAGLLLPALLGPTMYKEGLSSSLLLGVAFVVLLLAGVCYPFVRTATRRLDELQPADATIFR